MRLVEMLRWGLDKDSKVLVGINDVQRGKKCNCICPSCGTVLVAHKANKNAHHFKHYRTEECIGCVETAIHFKAKEIIASAKCIKLPSLNVYVSNGEYDVSVPIIPKPRLIMLDDEIFLEKKEGQIKPDLIASYKGKKLLIEIAVTHFVDTNKKNIIRDKNISCVEIDLHELHGSNKNITDDELRENIIDRLDNKKWIHNSKYLEAKKEAYQIIEKNKIEEREKKKLSEKEFNESILKIVEKNPEIIIDEDEIIKVRDGSNYVQYTLSINIYSNKFLGVTTDFVKQELQGLTVNIFVNEDDNSMFFGYIYIEDKIISNSSLEGFIERKIKSFCYPESISNWMNKRAKN